MTRKVAVLLVALATAVLAVPAAGVALAATPLRIADVAPDGGSTGMPTNTTISVDFASPVDSSTLDENIKLKRKGARKAVFLLGSYDAPNETFTGFPRNPLRPGTVYQVIVDGGRDGVRGDDGGRLGGVADPSARRVDGDVVWSFRTAG